VIFEKLMRLLYHAPVHRVERDCDIHQSHIKANAAQERFHRSNERLANANEESIRSTHKVREASDELLRAARASTEMFERYRNSKKHKNKNKEAPTKK
jgi:hypothetical protein